MAAGTSRAQTMPTKIKTAMATVEANQMLTALAWSRNGRPNITPIIMKTPTRKNEPKCNR
jgi:hypothetical protein